jgi:predicted nucleic acid-binding protein
MPGTVYVETSVVSYLTARPSGNIVTGAHQQLTREWWNTRRRNFTLYTSQLVLQEAAGGDPQMAQERLTLLEDLPALDISDEASALARALLSAGAPPATAPEDALHIAIAVVNGLEYLLTWNCRHIANAAMRKTIERVCRAAGYEPTILCTPEELLDE